MRVETTWLERATLPIVLFAQGVSVAIRLLALQDFRRLNPHSLG